MKVFLCCFVALLLQQASSKRIQRLLQDPGTREYAATLLYMDFIDPVTGEQCTEKSTCVMFRDGYIRYGATLRRTSKYVWSTFIPAGTEFQCTNEFFGEDPFPTVRKFCDINMPFPTVQPTRMPSQRPSLSPSPYPTDFPTRNPTKFPTPPTRSPTPRPTQSPTSVVPTLSPSFAPSLAPSTHPTQLPPSSPTGAPTHLATSRTEDPTLSPTADNVEQLIECLRETNATKCDSISFCEWTDSGCLLARNTKSPTSSKEEDSGENSSLSWVVIVATNLAILGIVMSICALAFIHLYRTKPVIQLSQTLFLKLLCIGAMLVNSSIFGYAFEPDSVALCVVRKWWFDLAFTFTVSVMLLKVWRVWRVFNAPISKTVHITNQYLLRGLLLLMVIDVVVLTLWSVVDPPSIRFDDARDSNVCESEGVGSVFQVLSYLFLIVLLLATAFFACRVKDLGSVLGESKQIFLIANNIMVWGLFNFIVFFAESVDEMIRVLVFSLSVFWCTTVGLFVLLHAKFERFHMTREEILRAATEKKHSRANGRSMDGRSESGYAESNITRQTSTTRNSGFLDPNEVLHLSGNAPRVSFRMDQQQSSSFWDQPAQTAHAPRVQADLFSSRSRRPNTDNGPQVQFAGGLGWGTQDDSAAHAMYRRKNPAMYMSSNASMPGDLEGVRSNRFRQQNIEMEHFGENRSQPSYYQPQQDKVLFRARTDMRSGENHPENRSRPSLEQTRSFFSERPSATKTSWGGTSRTVDTNTAATQGRALSSDGSPSSPIESAEKAYPSHSPSSSTSKAKSPLADQLSFKMSNPEQVKREKGKTAPKSPSKRPAKSVVLPGGASHPLVNNGFKIGERGAWEEYVHRETGESFWFNSESGEVSSTCPDNVVDVS